MKLWPFSNKQAIVASGTKSATFMFGAGALRQMQQNYEVFASEGYATNPIVRGCIEKLAMPLTSIDLQAYVQDKNGKLVKKDNHPILQLLNKPNAGQTRGEFIGDLARFYLISGNAFVYGSGVDAALTKPKPPKELYLFRPNNVKVVEGDVILPKAYEHRLRNNSTVTYPVNQLTGISAVMHKKMFHPLNQWLGLSPMVSAAFGIDVLNEGQRWNLRLLQNEGRPSGALTLKNADGSVQNLSEEQYRRLKEQLDQQISGSNNAGRPLLLEGGLEWQEMSMSAKDMDHEKNMNKSARDIALAYGVPAQLLGIPGDTTYSNVSEAKLSLWTDAILPLLDSILSSVNQWLAPMYGDGVILWYDEEMIPALEALRKQKADRIEASTSMSINEKRRAMGLEDVPGGDVVLVDSGKVPLELVGDMGLNEPGSSSATQSGNNQ
jgi:HK97 family phage portal protein